MCLDLLDECWWLSFKRKFLIVLRIIVVCFIASWAVQFVTDGAMNYFDVLCESLFGQKVYYGA